MNNSHSIQQGYCTMDLADITSIIDTADHTLFPQILTNPNHVLAHLLPEKVSMHYKLRPRQHDQQLIQKTTKQHRAVTSSSICSTNIHIDCSLFLFYFYLLLYKLHLVSFLINEHDDDDDDDV